ncbi:MAG: hypothetical protein ACFNYI_06260, partial [Eubacterium sp.]
MLVVIAAVIIMVMLAAAFTGKAYADDTAASQSVKVIHVSYSQGQHGIQKALNKARDKASASQPYEVVVEAGNYNLKKALHIYSNTELTSEPGTVYQETKKD